MLLFTVDFRKEISGEVQSFSQLIYHQVSINMLTYPCYMLVLFNPITAEKYDPKKLWLVQVHKVNSYLPVVISCLHSQLKVNKSRWVKTG